MLDLVGIGENIKRLRIQNNYSQEKLAEILYVSRQAVSYWEGGKSAPTIDNVVTLSKLFNIGVDKLLLIDEESNLPENILKNHSREYVLTLILSNELKFDLTKIFIYLDDYERMTVLKNIKNKRIKYDINKLRYLLKTEEIIFIKKEK